MEKSRRHEPFGHDDRLWRVEISVTPNGSGRRGLKPFPKPNAFLITES